ncbi:PqqD family protein [Constrictibacter sp. MBR-5]|uniref:PqqD family protein n=1 Tax=Constrictibacter sp. MBR-5 TaxID=3156467 RepID=UPI00339332A7
MSEETIITVAEGVVWTRVDDEIIAIDPRTEHFFGLRGAGIEAWEAIVSGTTVGGALAAILARYDVPAAQAKADLEGLLENLLARRLIGIGEQAPRE